MPTILSSKPATNSEYLRTYRFELIYPDVAGKWFTLNLISADIPSISFKPQRLWDGTVNTNYISKIEYETFRLEFYMNLISDPIYTWIQQHVKMADMKCPMNVSLSTDRQGIPTYKKNLLLKLYDSKQRTAVQFSLLGCLITQIQFDNLSYSQPNILKTTLTIMPDRVIYPMATNLYPDMINTVPGIQFLNRIQTNISDMVTGALGLDPGLLNSLMNIQSLVGGAFTMSTDTINLLGLNGALESYNNFTSQARDFMDKFENQGKACESGSQSIVDTLVNASMSSLTNQLNGEGLNP
jgi:hypothetical protein